LVGNGWSVSESDDYARGVAQCGGAQQVDEAIAPIIYALHRQPLAFPETEISEIRLARTRLRFNGPDVTLSHSVWFKVDETNRVVELLWVEYSRPDDMDWGENE
jgi:hypothetical protein